MKNRKRVPRESKNSMVFKWDPEEKDFSLKNFSQKKAKGRIALHEMGKILEKCENSTNHYGISPQETDFWKQCGTVSCIGTAVSFSFIIILGALGLTSISGFVFLVLSFLTCNIAMIYQLVTTRKVIKRAQAIYETVTDVYESEYKERDIFIRSDYVGDFIEVVILKKEEDDEEDGSRKKNMEEPASFPPRNPYAPPAYPVPMNYGYRPPVPNYAGRRPMPGTYGLPVRNMNPNYVMPQPSGPQIQNVNVARSDYAKN